MTVWWFWKKRTVPAKRRKLPLRGSSLECIHTSAEALECWQCDMPRKTKAAQHYSAGKKCLYPCLTAPGTISNAMALLTCSTKTVRPQRNLPARQSQRWVILTGHPIWLPTNLYRRNRDRSERQLAYGAPFLNEFQITISERTSQSRWACLLRKFWDANHSSIWRLISNGPPLNSEYSLAGSLFFNHWAIKAHTGIWQYFYSLHTC